MFIHGEKASSQANQPGGPPSSPATISRMELPDMEAEQIIMRKDWTENSIATMLYRYGSSVFV